MDKKVNRLQIKYRGTRDIPLCVLLDCNTCKVISNTSNELVTMIEGKVRNLLFQLHVNRKELLDALKKQIK